MGNVSQARGTPWREKALMEESPSRSRTLDSRHGSTRCAYRQAERASEVVAAGVRDLSLWRILMIALGTELKWIALTALILWGAAAQSQLPDRVTNLEVLPKSVSKAEIQSMMRGCAFSLNAPLDHCQAEY